MEIYEKETVLARGAFGTVYLGRNKSDSKKVVIKEIQWDSFGRSLDHSATEVRVLQLLKHPNVINFYEAAVTDDKLCMASIKEAILMFCPFLKDPIFDQGDFVNMYS